MSKGYKNFILFLSVIWILTVVIDIIYMILLYKPYFVDLSKVPFPVFIIIPLPVLLFYLPGYFTVLWFGFLIVVFSTFLLIAIATGLIKFENSAIFKISEFYAVNLFLSIVYFLFIDAIGKPVTVPISSQTPFYLNMLSLVNAGLYEELITRVLYIGIPLYIYYKMKKHEWGGNQKEVKWYRMIWGGNYKLGKPEITVLIISSLIFGIAHTASWDWSKMPQAFMGGLFLGYLFLRYGLYADVLWHFSVDATSAFLPEGLGNPYANGLSNGFATLVDLAFILAGFAIVIYYLVFLLKGRSSVKINTQQTNVIICPRCGSMDVSLIYDDIFRCNRCGNVFKKMK